MSIAVPQTCELDDLCRRSMPYMICAWGVDHGLHDRQTKLGVLVTDGIAQTRGCHGWSIPIWDGLSDPGAIMSLADTCGAVVVAQYYSRFHFYNRNTCVPFTHQFGFSLPTVQRVNSVLPTPHFLCASLYTLFSDVRSVFQCGRILSLIEWCRN